MSVARRWWLAGLVLALLMVPTSGIVRSLMVTRRAVATFTSLVAAANAQDLDTARSLCSADYLRSHRLVVAEGGGVEGLPRGIHPNFRAWREKDQVWLCSGNRVGPVWRFVLEAGRWKFDGLAGLIRDGWNVEPADVQADLP